MRFKKLAYQKLTKQEQAAWREEFYKLVVKSVPELEKEHCDLLFFNSAIPSLKYYILKDEQEKLLAVFCCYYHIIELDKTPTYIYNSRVVVSPDYQGKATFQKTFFAQFRALGHIALLKGGYFVSNMVSPLSYHGVVSNCQAYPKYNSPLESKHEQIIATIGQLNHYKLIKSKGIIKTKLKISPSFTQKQLDKIHQSDKLHLKYFLEKKIDFTNGEGLLIVVPYTVTNILTCLMKVLGKNIVKNAKSFRRYRIGLVKGSLSR